MAKPKCSTVLVVIDMQHRFSDSCKEQNGYGNVLKNVELLVQGAVSDGIPIIFLEYEQCGRTYQQLLEVCKGYSKQCRLRKPTNDGSKEVIEACHRLKIRPSHFVICGVNYSACVYDTIYELVKLRPTSRISLVKEATNYYYSSYFTLRFEEMESVEIVSLYGDTIPYKWSEIKRLACWPKIKRLVCLV